MLQAKKKQLKQKLIFSISTVQIISCQGVKDINNTHKKQNGQCHQTIIIKKKRNYNVLLPFRN